MKVGFVTLIGRPNTGKSSLLNNILQNKLSITSNKPQTTRNQIKGILNDENTQIIFMDTPGIHKPLTKAGLQYNKHSYSALEGSDCILFLLPISETLGKGDKIILSKIGKLPKIGVITKIDLGKIKMFEMRKKELEDVGFKIIIGTSIFKEKTIEELLSTLKKILPDGEPYYKKEELTNKSLRFLVKEIIRETAIDYTAEEIPHSIAVEITKFQESHYAEIEATIYVERNSQKGILIGKQAQTIKKIGILSRKKIKERWGLSNTLKLKVKVLKNWTKNLNLIKKINL